MSDVQIIEANGVSNGQMILDAAAHAGLPLAVAVAFMDQESDGEHIYGHDFGGVYSTVENSVVIGSQVYPRGSKVPVTRENYWGNGGNIRGFYNRVIIDGEESNGVGPGQITYRGYLTQARQMGYDLSIIDQATAFAFYLIADHLNGDFSDDKIKRTACWYNQGSESGYQTQWYALELMDKLKMWRGLLGGTQSPDTSTPITVPAPQQEAPVVSGYRFTTDYLNQRSGPGSSNDVINVIPKGTKVGISGKIEGGWYQVVYNGRWGWCSGTYLSATAPVVTTTTTTSKKKRR